MYTTNPTTPDLSGYYAIHNAMRHSNARLVEAIAGLPTGDARRTTALHRWYVGYAGELHAHHHGEDHLFFPALAARVPAFAQYDAELAGDHHRLAVVIDSLATALGRWAVEPSSGLHREAALTLATELRDLLAPHLDIEDDDVVPMFERHFTAEEYHALDQQMIKQLNPRQALFTVPWYMATVEAERAAETLRTAPLPLKVVYRLTRRRYARLARTAFGATS